ncbi:MAG: class I SAM-dependent DNA methyltransferase [Planctomycetes bacterium]|nr:class I SAM-dependent DNA methyltransferase [Planctomycetota bacterium]
MSTPATTPDAAATPPEVEAFIDRWGPSGGGERANYQLFLSELCDVIGVPRPDPSKADDAANTYVFDKVVKFAAADGAASNGFIDLYRRGAFVCETKQGVEKQKADALSLAAPSAPKPRRKTGTSVRGTIGWDDSMIAARGQAESYVRALADDNPPFLLVVDIGHSFELYADFSRLGKVYAAFPDARSHRFKLESLRDAAIRERLRGVWLDPLSLDPSRRAAKVTREIAGRIAVLAKRLETKGHDPESVAWFLIRCLFTFFAEDVGLIAKGAFTELLGSVKSSPDSFVPLVGELWKAMDSGTFSTALRKKMKRFNGGIFREHEPLKLDAEEIGLLVEAGECDWQDVEPAIFGTLLERALDPRERHKLGAHFTPRAYVERLVVPTIIEPVRDDWEAARAASLAEASAGRMKEAVAEARKFIEGLGSIRVLDPACGTGNFLYVSMVKLKEIEAEARDWLGQLGEKQSDLEAMERTVDPKQFLGIEINPRAVAIAEVVLWIGWLQWHLRAKVSPNSFSEPILHAYGNIECRDALLEYDRKELVRDEAGKPVTRWDGVTMKKHPVTGEDVPDETATVAVERFVNPRKAAWPECDFIVGNPPFLGSGRMRQRFGEGYAETLRNIYSDVPDSANYVMYWWDKAATLLRAGGVRQFGYITTNAVSQVQNKAVVIRHLAATESPISLVMAIPDHPWVDSEDSANVRIAMTVAVAGEVEGVVFDIEQEIASADDAPVCFFSERRGCIQASLDVGGAAKEVARLRSNRDLTARGMCIVGGGFVVAESQAKAFEVAEGAVSARLLRSFVNGNDITKKTPRKLWLIDCHGHSEQEVRDRWPAVYQWILDRVKPGRDHNNDPARRAKWWLLGRAHLDVRRILAAGRSYLATVMTAKHRVFVRIDGDVIPDQGLVLLR